jgi:hypothetical protein
LSSLWLFLQFALLFRTLVQIRNRNTKLSATGNHNSPVFICDQEYSPGLGGCLCLSHFSFMM